MQNKHSDTRNLPAGEDSLSGGQLSAAIDIGTNSCRLLILSQGQPLLQRAQVSRIGQDSQTDGLIKKVPLERTIAVLDTYIEILREHGLKKVPLVATSAVRDALNKVEVAQRIFAETGLRLEILSGQEEARLSWLGAAADFMDSESDPLVLDIGGGSTELIFRDNYISFNLGGVRLKENPDLAQSKRMREIFATEITGQSAHQAAESWQSQADPHFTDEAAIGGSPNSLSHLDFSGSRLILAGGTGTSLAAIHLKLAEYDWTKVHGLVLTLEEIRRIQDMLLSLDLEERKKVPGLQPQRADIIVFGTKILLEFMEEFAFFEVTVSEKDLLYALAERCPY